MAYTLLDLTQQILSSMDSDEVNSIGDTPESLQVANIIRNAWDEITSRLDLPEHYILKTLTSLSDPARPTTMDRPADMNSILWIKYDRQTVADPVPNFAAITFIPLDDFLRSSHSLKTDGVNVESVVEATFTYYVENDVAPMFFTTADDNLILFNSYDNTVDASGLVSSKTLIYGIQHQTLALTDGAIPFIDPDLQILLLNEAKSLAFLELKQMEHAKAEGSARKEWIHSMKAKRGVNREVSELDRLPHYGKRTNLHTSPFTKAQRSGS